MNLILNVSKRGSQPCFRHIKVTIQTAARSEVPERTWVALVEEATAHYLPSTQQMSCLVFEKSTRDTVTCKKYGIKPKKNFFERKKTEWRSLSNNQKNYLKSLKKLTNLKASNKNFPRNYLLNSLDTLREKRSAKKNPLPKKLSMYRLDYRFETGKSSSSRNVQSILVKKNLFSPTPQNKTDEHSDWTEKLREKTTTWHPKRGPWKNKSSFFKPNSCFPTH